jgi:DNA-directed RNA polymerase-3 subunit RPC5
LSRKTKRARGGASDSDSDDGPPPDPDEPAPMPTQKKEKKAAGEAREVQVSARKSEDKGGLQPLTGGLSAVRREMLAALRAEDDEAWQDIQFYDSETLESGDAFETVFSQKDERMQCETKITAFLKDIPGL